MAAACLVLATVTTHISGLCVLTWSLHRLEARDPASRGRPFLIGVAILLIVCIVALHAIEVWIWAAFYRVAAGVADWPTAVYLSLAAYSTTGTDQVVLSHHWRMLEGTEAITAALMFGVSTAFIYAIINEGHRRWRERALRPNG